jgi:hypothetical protein
LPEFVRTSLPQTQQEGDSPGLNAADVTSCCPTTVRGTREVDRIKKTYEESLQRVLPLKERLARTDRLIDQIEYRLYGLTEEEIGVVVGRQTEKSAMRRIA